uniref:Uncharacterized protein n=1 Tax=Neisseria meningitidis alpha522 TaxID=996307 RepID=I4E6W9_NEIME|nr:hypothetical protein NMALPHA522_1546 [Neisseria meningitidis alpha522]
MVVVCVPFAPLSQGAIFFARVLAAKEKCRLKPVFGRHFRVADYSSGKRRIP